MLSARSARTEWGVTDVLQQTTTQLQCEADDTGDLPGVAWDGCQYKQGATLDFPNTSSRVTVPSWSI